MTSDVHYQNPGSGSAHAPGAPYPAAELKRMRATEKAREWLEDKDSDKTAAVVDDGLAAGGCAAGDAAVGSAGSGGTTRVPLQLGLNGLQARHEQSLDGDGDVNSEEEEEEDGDGKMNGEGEGDGHRCT